MTHKKYLLVIKSIPGLILYGRGSSFPLFFGCTEKDSLMLPSDTGNLCKTNNVRENTGREYKLSK
jgi:hypothetical protein